MATKQIEFDELEELPNGWEWISLDELTIEPKVDIVDGPFGSNLKASEYIDAGIPIARLQNIDRNQFVFKNIRHISIEKAEALGRHNFKPGDILITKLGAPLGKACVAPKKITRGIIVADLVRIRIKNNHIDRDYLTYAINSPFLMKQFEKHTKGSTRPRVNLGIIRKLPIPVAPLNEQKRIVAEIEKQFFRLDEAVDNVKRVKANLKRYKAAVLKAAVEGKLTEKWRAIHSDVEPASKLLQRILTERRKKWEDAELAKMKAKWKVPKDDKWKKKYKEPKGPNVENLPSIPETWIWVTMPQIGELNRGKSKHRPRNDPKLYGGPYPFIQTGDVRHAIGIISKYTQTYSEEGLKQSRLWPKGTLCITIAANIADTAILGFNSCFPDSVVGFIPGTEFMEVRFVEYFIRTVKENIESFSPATAQRNINLEILGNVAVPLPPKKEQEIIIAEIERRLSVAQQVEEDGDASITRAERLRQSIFKKAFSGRFVPQDPRDEPASSLIERIEQEKQKEVQSSKKFAALKSSRRIKTVKKLKTKKPLLDVMRKHPDGITPENLLSEANFSVEEVDVFYAQLCEISAYIKQEKPMGNEAFKWPHELKVILRLREE